MSTPSIPNQKSPPKKMIEEAKKERARRKACHGDWTPCKPTCKKQAWTFEAGPELVAQAKQS